MSEQNLERRILEWLATGDTGVSSKTLAFAAVNIDLRWSYHPSDPSDFNRCLMLFQFIPELRKTLLAARALSPVWAAMVDRWDDIEASFLAEAGLNWQNQRSAPETYELMKNIERGAE